MLRWIWLSVVVVGLDQYSKYLAMEILQYQIPKPVFPFFNLFLTFNTGAAFSFLHDAGGWQRWFFVGLAVAASAAVVYWLKQLERRDINLAVALSLIMGGAIGNLIDRLLQGHVVDFIQVFYDRWYFPAFNIADSAITIGVILMLFDTLFGGRRKEAD
jgi:signal peptidase II